MATSLIIETLNGSNEKKQKSVTDINPDATSSEIIDFSQTLINLSTQSYQKTFRVDKEEVTDQKATFTVSEARINNSITAPITDGVCTATLPLSAINNNAFAIALYSARGVPAMNRFPIWQSDSSEMVSFVWGGPNAASGTVNRVAPTIKLNSTGAQTVQGSFTFRESDTTAAYTINFTITITEA